MENKWIKHTSEYTTKNGISLKDALNDHINATTYYMEKANDKDDCTTEYKLVMCTDTNAINAINESLSNMSLSYKANNKTIQQSRDFIRNKSHISK
jgi:hypothetical protein